MIPLDLKGPLTKNVTASGRPLTSHQVFSCWGLHDGFMPLPEEVKILGLASQAPSHFSETDPCTEGLGISRETTEICMARPDPWRFGGIGTNLATEDGWTSGRWDPDVPSIGFSTPSPMYRLTMQVVGEGVWVSSPSAGAGGPRLWAHTFA
jgi:hypothetical protein